MVRYLHRRFLLPYARLAQRSGAQEFVVGTELSSLYNSPRWNPIDAALRRVYHGTLAFDSNWYGVSNLGGAGIRGLTEGVHAYPAIPVDLKQGWETYDLGLPRRTVEMEVGIAAIQGAFAAPYKHSWQGKPIDENVQARWFAAACHAAARAHLGWDLLLVDRARHQVPGTNKVEPAELGWWQGGQGDLSVLRLTKPEKHHGDCRYRHPRRRPASQC